MTYKIIENSNIKCIRSDNYNYNFYKHNGYFERWGKDYKDDPNFSEFGPEILDLECTTICGGVPDSNNKTSPCSMCYKSNTLKGINMSIDTFKNVLDKFPPTLTQIAFGADATAEANPDLWKMMEYSRSKQIIPNITVANITDETADKLAKYCGAVAVSRYANKDICYNSIKKLTDRGMTQVNIHICVAEETFDMCMETIKDSIIDPRLNKLNAIVFLSLKRKGRGSQWHSLPMDKFKQLVDTAMKDKVSIGFDSCGANKFCKCIEDHPDKLRLLQLVEPCESSAFSSYVDVNGHYYPCSFTPNEGDWKEGIDILSISDFLKDVWYNEKTVKFRTALLNCGRNCPLFSI
ncbi:MAG: radical SAM protein [Candidatus Izimaplasma sp.]|nr:radical SAM protein [Candidatus Izimaplasma bacterium]